MASAVQLKGKSPASRNDLKVPYYIAACPRECTASVRKKILPKVNKHYNNVFLKVENQFPIPLSFFFIL